LLHFDYRPQLDPKLETELDPERYTQQLSTLDPELATLAPQLATKLAPELASELVCEPYPF
jgi:hypothetical protein